MDKMQQSQQPSFTSPPYPYPQPPPPPPPQQHTICLPGIALGKESQHMTCPHCHANISTRVEPEATTKTHLFALVLCLVGCWCCAPFPYCMDNCRVQKHYCPACNAYLGQYDN